MRWLTLSILPTCRRTATTSALGGAVRYMYKRWSSLTRFLDDPTIPLGNNAAERSLRGPVVGRKLLNRLTLAHSLELEGKIAEAEKFSRKSKPVPNMLGYWDADVIISEQGFIQNAHW
jgi:hypothetical protein